MRRTVFSLLLAAGFLSAQFVSTPWVELGENGAALVRVVVTSPQDCPSIVADSVTNRMSLRLPMPAGLRPVCEFTLPANARVASINGQPLPLPKPDPTRVITIGDTGCRVKDARAQACNDPAQWPFAQVAASAAREKPDLVVHVGDYLYRESPCPAGQESLCGGAPFGDNWDAWNADFFTPAAKLLAAAPWAFARGNHEACDRSWRGWFYYLDPRPWDGLCEPYTAPYSVKLGAFEAVVLDSASVIEDKTDDTKVVEAQVAKYAAQLRTIQTGNAWLIDHHPFWGLKSTGLLTAALGQAWNRATPVGISLILSGHVHLFELLNFDHGRPAQLVAGDGGTDLAVPIQTSADGLEITGARVVASQSQHQFGYTLLTRTSQTWKLTLKADPTHELMNARIRANIQPVIATVE